MHFDVKSSGEATPRWTMGGYRAEHHANELIFHVPSTYRGVDVLSDDTITTLHIKGVNIFGNTEIEFSEVEGDPTVAVGRYLIPRSITSSVGEYLASLKFVGADGVVAKSGTIRFLISDVVDADDDVIGDSDPNIIEQLSVRIAQSLTDAPSDGLSYVRKDGEWVEVDLSVGGGGDVTKVYVDTQDISTLTEAKEYVDSVGSQVYLDAKAYVDSLPTPDVDKAYVDSADQSILSEAKDYADTLTTSVELNGTTYTHVAGTITLPNLATAAQGAKADTALQEETDPLFTAWDKDYNDLTNKPTIPNKVSDLTNDSGYLTDETDPTVPAWAKAETKPTYTATEVGAEASGAVTSHNTSITAHSDIRTALDTKATVWSGTQAAYDALPTKDPSTLYLIVG